MMIATTLALLVALLPHGSDKNKGDKNKKSPEITVKLKTDSKAQGVEVRLGDVASVQCDGHPELVKRLLELDLGRPPQPGYTRIITRNEVVLRLLKEGLPHKTIKTLGGTQAYVQPALHTITPAELTAVADRLLDRAILQADHPDVTYKLRTNLAIRRVPIGRFSRQLKPRLKTGKLGHNHAQVDVDVEIDGKIYKTIPIYYSLTRHYKVLAMAFAVRPGTALNETNLEFKRIATPHGVTQYLTSFDQVRGRIARKLLRRGEMLTHQHLGVQAVIEAGDIVELEMQSGRIRVRTKVRAMDAGHLGKFIRVVRLSGINQRRRRANTNSILVAKIASPNTVVIDTNR